MGVSTTTQLTRTPTQSHSGHKPSDSQPQAPQEGQKPQSPHCAHPSQDAPPSRSVYARLPGAVADRAEDSPLNRDLQTVRYHKSGPCRSPACPGPLRGRADLPRRRLRARCKQPGSQQPPMPGEGRAGHQWRGKGAREGGTKARRRGRGSDGKSVELDGEGGVEGRMPPGGGLENPRLGLEG